MSRKTLLLTLLLVFALAVGWVSAQESTEEPTITEKPTDAPTEDPGGVGGAQSTEEPTLPPPITVSGSEPSRINQGQAVTLTVLGENFTENTTVRLQGVGLLNATFVNSTALTAPVPQTAPAGEYVIQVSDPERGSAQSPTTLTIIAPTATPRPTNPPQPTSPPPPTSLPPTPIPGEPSLLVRNYTVSPREVAPGGTVTLNVEIINQGSRTAQGIAVGVEPGSSFVPSPGQAAALLPDIPPGSLTTVTLQAAATTDASTGPNTVNLTLTYRDFEGGSYSSSAELTVNVQRVERASQVTLARYRVDPNPVVPGESVAVEVLLANTGNTIAAQVLFRINDGVLLAGPQGDSFPVGSIAPGSSASITVPLVVGGEANPGPQPQAYTITYLQDGETVQVTGSITLPVARVTAPTPLFLLQSYALDKDNLQPGDRFTMTMNLENIGDAAASELLVTFGTVSSTPGDSSGDNGSANRTTPSTNFAPLGTGGSIYIGTLDAGGTVAIDQAFIINGSLESGIYNLPITLRYLKPDGESGRDELSASVVVLVPPRLRIVPASSIPDVLNTGEPLDLALDVVNTGPNDVNLTFARFEVEGGDILSGDETYVGTLRPNDDTTLEASIIPLDPGVMNITLSLSYLDDLNQERVITERYTLVVMDPPPPPERPDIPDRPIITPEPVQPPPDPGELLGRILLGLLGLGS